MAAGVNPPIIDTAVAAWRDALRAMLAMPTIAGIAFVITVALAVVTLFISPDPIAGKAGLVSHFLSFVLNIINAFLIAPLAIAVHRYVLLSEVTSGYSIDPSNPRYLRFVTFSLAILLMFAVPGWILDALYSPPTIDPKTDPKILEESLGLSIAIPLVIVAVLIPLIIVVLRRIILFPAIAVDAAGASWNNAQRDTKGHSWRVAFVFICVTIPLIVIELPFIFPMDPSSPKLTGLLIVGTIIAVPVVCAYAAAASHLFRALADNLTRPLGSAPPTI